MIAKFVCNDKELYICDLEQIISSTFKHPFGINLVYSGLEDNHHWTNTFEMTCKRLENWHDNDPTDRWDNSKTNWDDWQYTAEHTIRYIQAKLQSIVSALPLERAKANVRVNSSIFEFVDYMNNNLHDCKWIEIYDDNWWIVGQEESIHLFVGKTKSNRPHVVGYLITNHPNLDP